MNRVMAGLHLVVGIFRRSGGPGSCARSFGLRNDPRYGLAERIALSGLSDPRSLFGDREWRTQHHKCLWPAPQKMVGQSGKSVRRPCSRLVDRDSVDGHRISTLEPDHVGGDVHVDASGRAFSGAFESQNFAPHVHLCCPSLKMPNGPDFRGNWPPVFMPSD